MADAKLDARQEGGSYRRIEVITGERRRRRWTAEEKARIVAESFEDGANISEVARRHGVARGLLTVWRHKFAAATSVEAPRFVPVRIDAEATGDRDGLAPAQTRLLAMARPDPKPGGVIEIEVSGARIRVEAGVELATLSIVLSAAQRRSVIALGPDLKVVLATQPVDFRKSVHTLSALVSEALHANPYCGDVFVFRSKRMDRLKLLAWDGSGMVLVTKWLHQGHFTWPPIRDGVVHLSATQLAMLLDGLEWTRVSPKPVRRPTLFG
jgi:transposase